jgi:hypothetical protein
VIEPSGRQVAELPVVSALRALSVFRADQAGAYREHFEPLAGILGADVETKLRRHVVGWAEDASPGVLVASLRTTVEVKK